MTKRDWLLLFIGLPLQPQGGSAPIPLDPIRIMKGMFLFQQDVKLPADSTYHFEPYLYGPCSFEIYRDLETLVNQGLIRTEKVGGRAWDLYVASGLGTMTVGKLAAKVKRPIIESLIRVKRRVTSSSFHQLLKEIYKEYPEYSSSSVFQP